VDERHILLRPDAGGWPDSFAPWWCLQALGSLTCWAPCPWHTSCLRSGRGAHCCGAWGGICPMACTCTRGRCNRGWPWQGRSGSGPSCSWSPQSCWWCRWHGCPGRMWNGRR